MFHCLHNPVEMMFGQNAFNGASATGGEGWNGEICIFKSSEGFF